MYSFEVDKPDSVDAAVTALAVEDAQALGGGQTLIPTLKQRLASPSRLVSPRRAFPSATSTAPATISIPDRLRARSSWSRFAVAGVRTATCTCRSCVT